jgi:hypothetical protein
MRSAWIGVVMGWCVCTALAACGSDAHSSLGGETNWLRACAESDDCSAGSCVCGLCSERCSEDDDCPRGLRCEREDSALHGAACGAEDEVPGLCSPECDADRDCGAGRACMNGACAPVTASGGGAGSDGEHPGKSDAGPEPGPGPLTVPGGTRLLVDAHLDLDAQCLPQIDKPIGSGASVYDIAQADAAAPACARPYMLVLRVQNPLSETVLVTELEITLLTVQQQTIRFAVPDPILHNPFRHAVTGSVPASANGMNGQDVVLAEAIPLAYAEHLEDFAGGELLIRAQIVGETASGEPVGANRFDYRVSLCQGCLSTCQSQLDDTTTIEQLNTGACDDRAGADGRYCIDSDC